MTQKDEKTQSLLSLFNPSEGEDVTQLANEYDGCKLHITFFCSSQRICDVPFKFYDKTYVLLEFLNPSQYFD